MNHLILITGLALFLGCTAPDKPEPEITGLSSPNAFAAMSGQDTGDFLWMNRPDSFVISEGILKIVPPANSDFFVDPANGKVAVSAPYLYREMTGDFVATALVQPDFSAVWNAANLLVFQDSMHWAKLAFENSDATGPGIVTVVTNGLSDDSNGAVLNEQQEVWLKLMRKGDLFAMHWSANGRDFRMARLFALPPRELVKIGIAAQCPAGGRPVAHSLKWLSLETKTVEDLRKGE